MTLDKNKENIPQYTQSINRSSALLLELVNNILDVNKINSNTLSISLDTFNVYNTLLNIYNGHPIEDLNSQQRYINVSIVEVAVTFDGRFQWILELHQ